MKPSANYPSRDHKTPRFHDVFLSFRGSDVRNTFIDHLYAALHRRRVRAFKDDVDLGRGESVRDGVSRAIEGSSFYVVVLTRNYASSAWCLDELVKIMGCCSINSNNKHDGGEARAFPVFYHLSPGDVSGADSGCYKADFDRHKRRYTYERVDGWIRALQWVVGISGWVVANGQSEAALLETIARTIRRSVGRQQRAPPPMRNARRRKNTWRRLGSSKKRK